MKSVLWVQLLFGLVCTLKKKNDGLGVVRTSTILVKLFIEDANQYQRSESLMSNHFLIVEVTWKRTSATSLRTRA